MIYWFSADNPRARPLPNLRNRTTKQLQDWIYDEIRQFLAKYVFLHKTDLTEFIDAVDDLSVLQRTGYPCRECGMKFKFHSTRVKYVSFIHHLAQSKELSNIWFCLFSSGLSCCKGG